MYVCICVCVSPPTKKMGRSKVGCIGDVRFCLF